MEGDRVHIHDICDHATYDRNRNGPKGPRGEQNPCAICGQGVNTVGAKATHWVHMKTDGHLLRHGETVDEQHDQGLFAIGPACYKRHADKLAGYVTRYTTTESGMKTEKI